MRALRTTLHWLTALAATLSGVAASPSVAQAGGWAPNDDDAVLFDVRLGQWRLGDGTRGYQTPEGICVDLADMIMALDIPVRLDKKLRRATGWAFEERNSLLIDREANIVQTMNFKKVLTASMVYDAPEGWCVNTKHLADWLGIGLEADTGNAVLRIKADHKLPVEQAIERKARAAKIRPISSFDLKTMPQSHIPYKGVKPPSVDAVLTLGGLSDGGKAKANIQYELYASGEIGPVAYDARLASNRNGVPESLRLRAYRTAPEGDLLPGLFNATELALGDVTGLATPLVSQSGIGRGAMVTNRPLDRPDRFEFTSFRGELPSGWDAELYRNGQLLGFAADRADGRYEFRDVPLLYGQNRFEIVLYGPQGQVKREEKALTVGHDSIPPKQTWYWMGINQDGRDLIDLGGARYGSGRWRGSVGFERGVDKRTSLQFAAHSIYVDKVGRRNFLEGSVRRSIGPALAEASVATDMVGGTALRARVLGEFAKTYITAETMHAFGGYASDRIDADVTGRHSLSLDRALRLGRSVLPLTMNALYTTRANGDTELDISGRTSVQFGRFQFTHQLGWRRQHLASGIDPPASLEASFLANARYGRLKLRGETRFRIAPQKEFQSATVVAEWTGKGGGFAPTTLRGELGYDQTRNRATLGLGYVKRFSKFAITGTAEVATDGSLSAGLNLSFSLGPDPRRAGGVRMTSSKLASQGQILARVYRDVNGDGVRQESEPLEKDVQLAAGRVPVRDLTDTGGAVIVDELRPFMAVLVGIDESSLPDPFVRAATPGIVVIPRPGVVATIDLPLVATGEVDGTLMSSNGNGMEGVDLELVGPSGVVAAKTRSDFDGYFLFEAAPYGKYSLRVAAPSAQAVRVKAALPQRVVLADKSPAVHLGVVVPEDMR